MRLINTFKRVLAATAVLLICYTILSSNTFIQRKRSQTDVDNLESVVEAAIVSSSESSNIVQSNDSFLRQQDMRKAAVKSLANWTIRSYQEHFEAARSNKVLFTKRIYYEPFELPTPKFLRPADEQWFSNYHFTKELKNTARIKCAEICSKYFNIELLPTKVSLEQNKLTMMTTVISAKTQWFSPNKALSSSATIATNMSLNQWRLTHLKVEFCCADPVRQRRIAEQTSSYIPFVQDEYLFGQLDIVADGHVPRNWDCGWGTQHDQAVEEKGEGIRHVYEPGILWFLSVPDGGSIQHFIDGVLPKIAQSAEWLLKPNVKAYVENSKSFPIVKTIYRQALNFSDNQLVYTSRSSIHILSDYLLLGCITPPLHPYLWQYGQKNLLKVERDDKPNNRPKIVYTSRGHNVINGGRTVLNEQPLIEVLEKLANRHQYELVVYDHKKVGTDNFTKVVEFWKRTRLLIGPHGGAMTNLIFMPVEPADESGPLYRPPSTVVEFLPVLKSSSKPPLRHTGMMMYLQSVMVGHSYWMVPVETTEKRGDMQVPIETISSFLEKLLSNQL